MSERKYVRKNKTPKSTVEEAVQKTPVLSESKQYKHHIFLVFGVVGVVLMVLTVGIFVVKRFSGKTYLDRMFLEQKDTLLRNEKSEIQGSVSQTKEFNTTRVTYRFKRGAPDEDMQYNGWLLTEDKSKTKYAGEFYLSGLGEYALTFSTQDQGVQYAYVAVSMDKGVPEKPVKIILGGGI